jgi:hypothetical protein
MSSSELMILVVMTLGAMTVIAFWRKVLILILSVVIAVFFYGLVNVAQQMHA